MSSSQLSTCQSFLGFDGHASQLGDRDLELCSPRSELLSREHGTCQTVKALAFSYKSLKPFKLFRARSAAVREPYEASPRARTSPPQCRAGLVFKAHRLVYHSTLGLTVIKKKKCDQTHRSVFPGTRMRAPQSMPCPLFSRALPFRAGHLVQKCI